MRQAGQYDDNGGWQLNTVMNRSRRGMIIIVTMMVVFTITSIVIVLCSTMRVESMSSANLAASLQAATVERGAEQYVLALLAEQKDSLPTLTDDYFAQVQVGNGYFWLLRPNYGDNNLPMFGLTDENAKLNINTATYESLMRLPNMTDDVASAIIDWRGGSSGGGGQDGYYAGLNDPYRSKKAPFETVEETLLVQGATRVLLYGGLTVDPLGVQSDLGAGSAGSQGGIDLANAHGIYDLLTVYSSESSGGGGAAAGGGAGAGGAGAGGAGGGGGGKVNISDRNQRSALQTLLENQLGDKSRAASIINAMGRDTFTDVFDFYFAMKLTPDEFDKIYNSITATADTGGPPVILGANGATPAQKGRINVNTAPRDVLFCIPGLEAADVDNLISARQQNAVDSTSVAWIADVLGQKKSHGMAALVTGTSYQYSADILAVSGNGRGFKRCRIVVDTTSGTPQIIYRRDMTDRGWPMDPQILTSLRTGQDIGTIAAGSRASGGMTR